MKSPHHRHALMKTQREFRRWSLSGDRGVLRTALGSQQLIRVCGFRSGSVIITLQLLNTTHCNIWSFSSKRTNLIVGVAAVREASNVVTGASDPIRRFRSDS